MINWFKSRSRQEKWMIALIAVLLIGVVVRWGFIKREAGDAFKSRIEHFKSPDKREPVSETDSAGWNVIRDSVTL